MPCQTNYFPLIIRNGHQKGSSLFFIYLFAFYFSSVLHNYKKQALTFSFHPFLPFIYGKLFESSALMHLSAVKSLLSALRQLSHQCVAATATAFGPSSSQKLGSISFSVERMISILVNNLHSMWCQWFSFNVYICLLQLWFCT